MIDMRNIQKTFVARKKTVHALAGIDLHINKAEMTAIMGPSGSGKTTLLNIMGGLLHSSKGEYFFNNKPVPQHENDMAEFRRKNVGFILQNIALIRSKNLYYNISLPLRYGNIAKQELKYKTEAISEVLGIQDKLDLYPHQLSGGERQRAAIARAMITNPAILLADEPSSSLDEDNREIVTDLLTALNQKGKTILIATHDTNVAKRCKRIIRISSGKIVADTR